MAYIIGLIVVALFFLSLHYFTELNHKQKIITSGVVLAIISSAIAFNAYTGAKSEHMRAVVTKYNQGKTVDCEGIEVNATNFGLSMGTYTFIGKENTPNYGKMISVDRCK